MFVILIFNHSRLGLGNSGRRYQKAVRDVAVACQLRSQAADNSTESQICSFAPKPRVLLPLREDFGLFITVIGYLHKTLFLFIP
jgi:hypothetical protein